MSQTGADLGSQLQRAMDLVRYARHFLHEEGLISDDELGALIADSENGQRVARLESYDDVRGKAAAHDILKATCERRGKERDQLREQRDALAAALERALDAAKSLQSDALGLSSEGPNDPLFEKYNYAPKWTGRTQSIELA